MLLTGRVLVVVSLLLMFFAYSNFAPTALGSEHLADYVKNHFVREMMFGVTLAILVIVMVLSPLDTSSWLKITLLGSAVVLPFWVAKMFGWSTGGIEAVWGEAITETSAYMLHVPQVVLFYIGVILLKLSISSPS